MCDPFTAGIIGAIGSIGSAVANYSAQSSAMSKQNDANAQWIAFQRQQSQEASARDEANRAQAMAAQQQSLQKVSGQQQMQQQQTEEKRVTEAITPDQLKTPTNVGDMLLSGQKSANPQVSQAMTNSITNAAQDARQRIAALATVESFGPSQFGLNNYVNQSFQTGNQGIDLYNDYRRGDLAAYGVAKNVEPIRYQVAPGAGIFGDLATGLAKIAGTGLTSRPSGVV
jgi:hypothetical protein